MLAIVACCIAPAHGADTAADIEALGEALFFDTGLSLGRSQSCATCHNPALAFTDSRDAGVARAVSLGDDGISLGDRNTPTTTYASLIPSFGRDANGEYAGGLFYDGRASTMLEQAKEPFTNPIEMAMPDRDAVVARVLENPRYVDAFASIFGTGVLSDTETAMQAIAGSIVAFEKSAQFAPFDSKYDRFLRGEYRLTPEEEIGRVLFYSQLFNCHSCHLLDTREYTRNEAFSTFRYHNIGVPANAEVRRRNGLGRDHRDLGLLQNPQIDDLAQAGKFKVPTLRNVAVTGPYMHNGVFRELETVIVFYNKFTLSNRESQTNPETGADWGPAEVPETVDLALLRQGQPISPMQVKALVAFLQTLTDQRYEGLLPP